MPISKIERAGMPGGAVLQVVQTYDTTYRVTSSSSYQDTFSAAITPVSANSRILVAVSLSLSHPDNDTGYIRLLRDATEIGSGISSGVMPGVLFAARHYSYNNDNSNYVQHQYSQTYIDSPNKSTEVVYKIQYRDAQGNGRAIAMNGSLYQGDSNMGRTTSSITLMEIAA